MKRFMLMFLVSVCTGCASALMWIPLQTTPRESVSLEHVQYLQAMPERPYDEIGIITPPMGEYETEAELVHAMREEAAYYGADAIFIESATEQSGWKFSFGGWGASGGSFEDAKYRAKAIVWR